MLMIVLCVLLAVMPCAYALRTDVTLEPSATSTTAVFGFDCGIKTVAVGETFTLNVIVSNVNNLTGWQWWLNYASNIKCGSNVEGPFLLTGAIKYGTFKGLVCTPMYAWGYDVILGRSNGASGSGVISILTFQALTVGTVTLHLIRTELCSTTPSGWPIDIPFTQTDCTVNVT